MKISPLNLVKSIAPAQTNFKNYKPSFAGIRIIDSFCDSEEKPYESYKKFVRDVKEKFPDKTIPEVLSEVSLFDDFIGEGRESKVYRIKGLDDYVIKLKACEYDYDPEWYKEKIKPCEDDFAEYNFGQTIAEIGYCAKILKKVQGEPNGIKNWYMKFLNSTPRTKEDAEKVLSDVVKVAKFPQKSFDKVAEEISFLTSKNIKVDSFNPNNILLDFDKKQINLVDIDKKPYRYPKNTMYDLLVPLLDLTELFEYSELFDEKQMETYLKSAKIIYEKVKKTGLPDDIGYDKSYRTRMAFDNFKALRLEHYVNIIKGQKK